MAQRSASRKPRSSASRRSSKKKSGGVPGWVWLVTGVLVGLFAAFLVYLMRFDSNSLPGNPEKGKAGKEAVATKEREKPRTTPDAPTKAKPAEPVKEKPAATPAAAEAKPSAGSSKPAQEPAKTAVNYDFYKILPQYEVVVPEEDSRKSATTASSTPGTYYLQVGSFRQIQEADGRKAELAMLGIVSSIQTVTSEPGNTWHRVRIGPVSDMRQLDRTKRQLQDNNIAFVTLKEKN